MLTGSQVGWIAFGLAGGLLTLRLLGGKFAKRKEELVIASVMTAALMTMGLLSAFGSLPTQKLGWGILGTSIAGNLLFLAIIQTKLQKGQVRQS